MGPSARTGRSRWVAKEAERMKAFLARSGAPLKDEGGAGAMSTAREFDTGSRTSS